MMQDPSRLQKLAHRFEQFAVYEATEASPLYARFCLAVAQDEMLLGLAAHATSRPVPNLFLAAVQYLLRREPGHSLRAFYPTLGGAPALDGDPVPLFRAFCRDNAPAIQEILCTRRVQTNEVRRCALLLPAFGLVARQADGRPLALVEIGTSAGLNLLWDQYAYDYGTGHIFGNPSSQVRLACRLQGESQPPLPDRMPAIVSRLGIDLQPVDVQDPRAVDWLRALIWPEHTARLARLEHAVETVRASAPTLLAGDALDLLPQVLAAVPEDALLCLYHTFTLNQFSPEARNRFQDLLDTHGASHDLCCLSILGVGASHPQLRLLAYQDGHKDERLLARCDAHGQWLAWLDRP